MRLVCRFCSWPTSQSMPNVHDGRHGRFALAIIHSHSGATGVFRNAFMGGDFLFTKNTADDIGSFTAVCVVGVLGAINCEYRQTFMFAMCGIVTFLM